MSTSFHQNRLNTKREDDSQPEKEVLPHISTPQPVLLGDRSEETQNSNKIRMNQNSNSFFISHSLTNLVQSQPRTFEREELSKCMHIPQKYLSKDKKYYKLDQSRGKESILKNDIETIINSIVKEKEQNDTIISNLRKNYQNQKLLSISKKAPISKPLGLSLIKKQKKSENINDQKENQKPNQNNKRHIERDLNVNQENFFSQESIVNLEMKRIKKQLKFYVSKLKQKRLGNSPVSESNAAKSQSHNRKSSNLTNQSESHAHQASSNYLYKEYLRLCQESYDCLEYFLKTSYLTEAPDLKVLSGSGKKLQGQFCSFQYGKEQIESVLKNSDKKIMLSVFRAQYRCLQSEWNDPTIINRILLAFGLNPANDFEFVKQTTFNKVLKIISGCSKRSENHEFLLRYIFLNNVSISQSDFDNSILNILKKLSSVINSATVLTLKDKIESFNQKIAQIYNQQQNPISPLLKNKVVHEGLKQKKLKENQVVSSMNSKSLPKEKNISKNQMKWLLANDPLQIWDLFVELIFLA